MVSFAVTERLFLATRLPAYDVVVNKAQQIAQEKTKNIGFARFAANYYIRLL